MVEKRERNSNPLAGKKVYIPRMTWSGAAAFAAAIRGIGIDAQEALEADEETMKEAGLYISGDECYPARVTLAELLRIIRDEKIEPSELVFFMPTSGGPCRFGQYAPYIRRLLDQMGLHEIEILSPSSRTGYREVGENAGELMRIGWWALVAADILRKMLLKTRPYEIHKGDTEKVYQECVADLCTALEDQQTELKEKFDRVKASLIRCKEKFKAIEVQYDPSRPLIGVVGEIFCRLNRFSNENLIRRIEEQGGECWLSDVGEWIWYTNWEQQKNLSLEDKRFSKEMLKVKLTGYVQKKYEHQLYASFHEEFKGYEEPEVETMMKYVEKYLPPIGALGEMVLSVGKTLYLYNKGADGIVDISPFSCMNGIVCEGVYPRVSQDCDNMPIRIFYFDGTQSDLERDIGIFIELARNYQRRKKINRVYPHYFKKEKMAG